MKRALSFLVSSTILLPTLLLPVSAASRENVSVTLEKARGGADAIVSMTYDDGDYESAVYLKGLCEKYGLSASLMLIVERLSPEYAETHASAHPYPEWDEIFEGGYLSPENHSYTHMVLPSDHWAKNNGDKGTAALLNNTNENYERELIYSSECLREWFDTDALVLAPSNNTLSVGAMNVVRANFYAVRQGSRGVQSLDPTVGSTEAGGWYNLYMRRIDDTDLATMKSYVAQCVENDGWFLSLTHSVKEEEKQARYDAFFAYISELVASGDVWCTDFSTATRYIRERQNTTADAYRMGDRVYLTLAMQERTEEGLPLPADVFCEPLTARLTVPDTWREVSYTLGDTTVTASTFRCGSETCVYVDAVPNGEQLIVTATLTEEIPEENTPDQTPQQTPDTPEENGFVAFLKSLWEKIVAFFRDLFASVEEK